LQQEEKKKKPTKKQLPNDNKRRAVDDYLKYSGLAFQLAAVLIVGVLAGKWLDNYFSTSRPYFTALLALVSLAVGMYASLKDLIRKDS
jgi:ATP synthase protein I